MTTIIEILLAAIGLLAIAVLLADRGCLPTEILGRVDHPSNGYAFYKAENFLQAPFVRLLWAIRTKRMKRRGLMFVVPGNGDRTTSFDCDRWRPHAEGMTIIRHILRIRHNNWRQDMTHDAIVYQFATSADRETFMKRVAATGPSNVTMMDLLDPASRAELTTLLERNRQRTLAEAA